MDQVVEPKLDGLRKQIADLGKQSGGLISAELHDLRRFHGVHQPGAVEVALGDDENLSLVLEPAAGDVATDHHTGPS